MIRLNLLVFAFVACFVMGATAQEPAKKPKGTTEEPAKKPVATAKDLVGTWESNVKLPNPFAFLLFEADGRMFTQTRIDNGNVHSIGKFKIEDNRIVFTATKGFSRTFIIRAYRENFMILSPEGAASFRLEFSRKPKPARAED